MLVHRGNLARAEVGNFCNVARRRERFAAEIMPVRMTSIDRSCITTELTLPRASPPAGQRGMDVCRSERTAAICKFLGRCVNLQV